MSRPELRPRAMSGPITLLQPESVLMSMAHITTRGHGNAVPSGLGTGHLSGRVVPLPPGKTGVFSQWCEHRIAGP